MRPGTQEHAIREPLIRRAMLTEVPLAGLPFSAGLFTSLEVVLMGLSTAFEAVRTLHGTTFLGTLRTLPPVQKPA